MPEKIDLFPQRMANVQIEDNVTEGFLVKAYMVRLAKKNSLASNLCAGSLVVNECLKRLQPFRPMTLGLLVKVFLSELLGVDIYMYFVFPS